ncbi:MAG: hypothetical protein JSU00_03110 [Acidobacteria bacterium]|nr:hypothetical protein [Acidobacteriota bacterium]
MLIPVVAAFILLAADPVAYMGREVRVVDPGTGGTVGSYPNGEARVCVKGQPDNYCYTAPKGFGGSPNLSVIELRKGESALFFETASGGVSGFSLHFALLEFCDPQSPGCGRDRFDNLLPYELRVSNLSQHAWWNLPAISDSKVFLTADYVWGPREAHYSDHRFIVSVYVRRPNDTGQFDYWLVDRFMTVRYYRYGNDGELDDVLGAEKPEVLARLRRVKASWTGQTKPAAPK